MKGTLKKIEGEWFASVDEDTNIAFHPDNKPLICNLEELGWINLIKEIHFEIMAEGGKEYALLTKSLENPLNFKTECYCGHTDWCECFPICTDQICSEIKGNMRASLIYDPTGSAFLEWLLENYSVIEKK